MDAGGQYIGYDQNQLFSYITKIYKTQLEHKLVDTYETSTFANGKKINSLGKLYFMVLTRQVSK